MKTHFSIIIILLVISCVRNKDTEPPFQSNKVLSDIDTELTDWYMASPKDSLVGIAMDSATYYISKLPQKPTEIIVALIDAPVDIYHEELIDMVYTNPNEIPDNNIDDDNNGYIDDIHGWNYLGSRNGKTISVGNFQPARILRGFMKKYNVSKVSDLLGKQTKDSMLISVLLNNMKQGIQDAEKTIAWATELRNDYYKAIEDFPGAFENPDFIESLPQQVSNTSELQNSIDFIKMATRYRITIQDINNLIDIAYSEKLLSNSLTYDPYLEIDDSPDVLTYNGYGNNKVWENSGKSMHGTQTSGLIVAKRNNGIGIKGISNNIKLMPLSIMPIGAPRDKDFINAVQYAVDNGARIINYSISTYHLEHQESYFKAVEYAHKNNVLFVTSAGNENLDLDIKENVTYPSGYSLDAGERLNTFISVGAANKVANESLKWSRSCYGKNNVDIFAPGAEMITTNPTEGKYFSLNGTSLSASVTSGVAAMVLSYYPDLTAAEIKNILLSTATTYDTPVKVNDTLVRFNELSRCGGVINAFEALKMAKNMSD